MGVEAVRNMGNNLDAAEVENMENRLRPMMAVCRRKELLKLAKEGDISGFMRFREQLLLKSVEVILDEHGTDRKPLCQKLLSLAVKICSDDLANDQGPLWTKLEASHSLDGRVTVLTAIADQLFAGEGPLYKRSVFFESVQGGLVHCDNFVRKRSLYLLKRAVNHAQKTNDEECDLIFQAARFHQVWYDFFLVIECAAEKQVHIVKQITSRLAELTRLCHSTPCTEKRPIHFSWVLCLYKIMFKHQNQAIARWSVGYFLQMFVNRVLSGISLLSSDMKEMVMQHLLPALNNPKLFQREDDPPLEQILQPFLLHWTLGLSDAEQQEFWNSFLRAVFDSHFDIVPLFFILEAILKSVPESASLLTPETLLGVSNFVERGMRNQHPLLKGGAQAIILHVIMKTTAASVLAAPDSSTSILSFLAAFHRQRSVLVEGTNMWSRVKEWVAAAVAEGCELGNENLENESDDEIRAKTNSLAILLSTDVQVEVDSIKGEVADSANRPYNRTAKRRLMELELVLRFLQGPERRKGREEFMVYSAKRIAVEDFDLSGDDFCAGVLAKLGKPGSIMELSAGTYLLDVAFRCTTWHSDLEGLVMRSLDLVVEVTSAWSPDRHTSAEELMAMNVLKRSCRHPTYRATVVTNKRLQRLLTSGKIPMVDWVIPPPSICPDQQTFENDAERRLWAVNQCSNIGDQWEIVREVFLGLDSGDRRSVFEHLVEAAGISASGGGAAGLDAAQSCMEVVLSDRSFSTEKFPYCVSALVNQCLSSVFDFRKNEHFFPLVSSFVKMSLCDNLLLEEGFDATADTVISKLMAHANQVQGTAALVASRISSFVSKALKLRSPSLVSALVAFLTFGTLYRKDQRLVEDANKCVARYEGQKAAKGVVLPVNIAEGSDHLVESIVRAHGLKIILLLRDKLPVPAMTDALIKADSALPANRRQYENSIAHLTKHRIYQTLLVITEFCNYEQAVNLLHVVLLTLVESSLQPSIRHLCEWIAVRLCYKYPALDVDLSADYQLAKTERLGAVPSFLFIKTHIAICCPESDITATMKLVAPWCMAQHFSTRTTAQVCFKRLYEKYLAICSSPVAEFAQVLNCVEECAAQGDQKKNNDKLEETPILTHLDPIANFNVRDMLYHFPRIVGLLPGEWKDFEAYRRVLCIGQPAGDLGASLSKAPPRLLKVTKVRGGAVKASGIRHDMQSGVHDDEDSVIQKKIMPWMSMMEEEDESRSAKKRAFPDLILVTSLIDRLPNLGGLCRTCEILGVGKYVLGSKRFADDKEFQNTSVTAEKWVPIEEVPSSGVSGYIEEKKGEGYTIVAIEQTSESISLEKFLFPRKTVLLLGNERAGIPVDLIRQVDACVEIPQKGLIRSFNVHVTGALVLWEYVKQHGSES
jgi:tRNA(Leu) C34 or U34 (ribose-2'-O)-methylase TrmL